MDISQNHLILVLYNENYEELCKNAREKVVQNFDSKIVAKKYIALYEEILSGVGGEDSAVNLG